jgi:NADH-quinone oxidoreductase subunit E
MSVPEEHPTTAAQKFEQLCRILDNHDRHPSRLIPILQKVQKEYQYLPEEVLTFIATSLRIPAARVFGVATFYSHFILEPRGKHLIRLCDGTACHVKNSIPILDALRNRLEVTEKSRTSSDMLFTVDTVACLGACGLAPVVVIDDIVHPQMTPERALALIEEIALKEKAQ